MSDKTGRMESGNGFTGLLAWSSPSANLVGVWKSDPARSGLVPSYIFALIISLSDADLIIFNGRHPGRFIVMIATLRRKLSTFNWRAPERIIPIGYLLYMLLGAGILTLPWCQKTAGTAGFIDHLFTSTSAVSTTGLATVSVYGSYSFLGQLVILILIQGGGLGYMTFGSCITLAISGKISPFRQGIASSVFSMPEGFRLERFLMSIILFTLLIELMGAIALYPVFRNAGLPMPWWQAVFHSVSAFCTAGFSLIDTSFEGFRGNIWLNVVIMILSYLGAVGFIVMNDWWEWLSGRKKGMTLTSKIILGCTVIIFAVGTLLFVFDEPTVRNLPWLERITASAFQVMSASTTVGFNTVPIGALSGSSLFLLTIVMIIGASPSGTGGGLKTTCITAMWAVMTSVFRRNHEINFAGRIIPPARIHAAGASVMFYLMTLSAGVYLLLLTEQGSPMNLMFECASALGTVGLSCGITGSLSAAGKIIIISLMYLGRLGPLALGLALFSKQVCDLKKVEDVVV